MQNIPTDQQKRLNTDAERATITHRPERIELRCAHNGCHLPFAYFEDGCLVIVSYHNHEKHTNRIPLQMAVTLAPQAL